MLAITSGLWPICASSNTPGSVNIRELVHASLTVSPLMTSVVHHLLLPSVEPVLPVDLHIVDRPNRGRLSVELVDDLLVSFGKLVNRLLDLVEGVYSPHVCLQEVVLVLDPVLYQVLELLHLDFDDDLIDVSLGRVKPS